MADTVVEFGILIEAGGPLRSCKAGDIILREGDRAKELFVIKVGSVEIRLGNRLPEILPARSIFGETSLIDHGPAVAATDATLVPVDEKQLLLMVSGTPFFALNVMRFAARRPHRSNSVVN